MLNTIDLRLVRVSNTDYDQLVEVGKCTWLEQNREPTEHWYPKGSNEKTLTHVAIRYFQPPPQLRRYREPAPSLDYIETRNDGGTLVCFQRRAFAVTNHLPYYLWCVELYRFQRQGRIRKWAGWTAVVAGGASMIAMPALAVAHVAWIGPLAATLITGAGGAASASGAFVANGAQGIKTGPKRIGNPVERVVWEETGNPVDLPPACWSTEYEDGLPRVCGVGPGGDHTQCK